MSQLSIEIIELVCDKLIIKRFHFLCSWKIDERETARSGLSTNLHVLNT
jgi:hypothetical protein